MMFFLGLVNCWLRWSTTEGIPYKVHNNTEQVVHLLTTDSTNDLETKSELSYKCTKLVNVSTKRVSRNNPKVIIIEYDEV